MFFFAGIYVYMTYSIWHSVEGSFLRDEHQKVDVNVAIDEDTQEIVNFCDDLIDGSSVWIESTDKVPKNQKMDSNRIDQMK